MQTNHADAAMLSELPNATHFVTSIFVGRGEYAKHESADLAAARAVGNQMAAHYRNGRKALVYAQLPNGRQFLVPDDYQPKETTMTTIETTATAKTFGKRFNAQRAAKAALGKDAAEGVDFTTAKNDAGEWLWTKVEVPTEAASESDELAPISDVQAEANIALVAASERARAAKRETTETVSETMNRIRKTRATKAVGDPLIPPDFSAKTHAPYRKKLSTVVAMVEARDVDGLKAFHINPTSTSPRAILRYKERALAALCG